MKKKKFSALMIIICILGITVCGCGQSTDSAANAGSGSSFGPNENISGRSGISADSIDLSNTLIYAGENENSINPVLTNHNEITDIVFSGLMKYDANGKPVTDLAESYEYNADSFTYTFLLRDGVKWHDGADFTAEDVVFTYETLLQDETLSSSLTSDYEDIRRVEALDDHTVEIQLEQYDAAILGYFTIGIIPKHLLEGEDLNTTSFNQAPVGTGRYRFSDWDMTGGMITLMRNEEYYDKVPNIERIIYKTVAVESTKATMLQSGEADLAWLNANYAATFRDQKGYRCWDFTTADYRAVSMDMSSDFWRKNADSIGVLNYAIDKDAIVNSVLNGQGCAAYSPIQINPLGSNIEADIYSCDPDRFASEMEALGWKKGSDGIYERNGDRFHFTIQTRDYEEERIDIANLMSNMLKQAGVEMEVALVTKFDWTAGYDGFLAGYAAPFDPDMAYKQFVTDASDNTMHYSNEEVDRLLTEGRHTANEAKRREIYGEFEKVYADHPGIVLAAYLDGNYVGCGAVDGLDTTRVLGHHAVGVMWNIEEWTISR